MSAIAHGPADIARMNSGEQVQLYIRGLIFDGSLRSGQKVPQGAIAEALGVSRIPVREALVALEREGWITQIAHRGAFINAIDEPSIRDHYELHGVFYGFGARQACERGGTALAAPLEAVRKRIAKAEDTEESFRLTTEFHRTVIDGTGSLRLKTMFRQLADIVPGNFFELVPGSEDVVREGTAAITMAIGRGYPEIAEREYAVMLRGQGDLVVELFRQGRAFS